MKNIFFTPSFVAFAALQQRFCFAKHPQLPGKEAFAIAKAVVINMIPKAELMRLNRDGRKKGSTVAEHSHNYCEFVYYISAEGQLNVQGETRRIKPGRFTVMKPGTVHSEHHEIDAVVFFFVFECDIPFEYGIYDDDGERSIGRLCEAMASEYFSKKQYSGELLSLMLSELLLRVFRMRTSREEGRRDIAYAARFIEKQYREKIDFVALSADIGYGYDHFHHLFSKRYGVSPKKYQMGLRIEHAKRLLSLGRYTCTEVAYLSGFYDSAQFAVIFKRECGLTPSEFART